MPDKSLRVFLANLSDSVRSNSPNCIILGKSSGPSQKIVDRLNKKKDNKINRSKHKIKVKYIRAKGKLFMIIVIKMVLNKHIGLFR
jgi:hypothetical protein